MKRFKWILTEDLYMSALAALAAAGAPVAMYDRDGCEHRFTATASDDGVDIVKEKKFTDTRGCEAWSGVDAVAFLPDGFRLRSMGDLALLSLALHAASANCTDDDGKLHTLDGVTTAHLDDLDLSCSVEGFVWKWRQDQELFELGNEHDCVLAEVSRGEPGEWFSLVRGKLPGPSRSTYREAMTDAEATLLDDANVMKKTGMDVVPTATIKPRCPLHGCASGDRTCERAAYNREACAKMVQETVVPPETPAIEVVDATPAKTHHDRLLRCGEMLLQISEDAIVDVFDHLCAIVEVEAGE